jgi:hypothetical protein
MKNPYYHKRIRNRERLDCSTVPQPNAQSHTNIHVNIHSKCIKQTDKDNIYGVSDGQLPPSPGTW